MKAGEHQEPICELELELLAGETADLLRLAHRLLESGVLRQGSLSKAARGYHLAQGNNERPVTRLAVLPVAAKASVEQGLEAALESAPRIGCITTRSGCAATQKPKRKFCWR